METMDLTIEKAKAALAATSKMRLMDLEGLAHVANHTTDPLLIIECIRRIKCHIEPLVDTVITLHGYAFAHAPEGSIAASKEGVDEALRNAGFDPEMHNALVDLETLLDETHSALSKLD